MTDADDRPIYPLIGYGAEVTDGMIALDLDMATRPEEYEARSGALVSVVMTPADAIKIARTLLARAEAAQAAGRRVN